MLLRDAVMPRSTALSLASVAMRSVSLHGLMTVMSDGEELQLRKLRSNQRATDVNKLSC